MWHRPCTKVLPARVHPTQVANNVQNCEYIVPEIHPSHVNNITNHHYKHIHSFPQTQSFQQNITNQNFVAPSPGPIPGAVPGVAGAGFGAPGVAGAGVAGPGVAGAGWGPGVAPRRRPGLW